MRRLLPILILVLGVLAIYVDMPGSRFFLLSNPNGGLSQPLDTKLGLDLKGGFEVKYGVDTGGKGAPSASQMETIRSIIEKRVNSLNVSEPVIQVVGTSEILVQVPGATDPSAVESLVGQVGKLDFVLLPAAVYGKFDPTTGADVGGTKAIPAEGTKIDATLPIQFTGAQLDLGSISAAVNPKNDGTWQVNFAFAGDAASAFSTWSSQHIDEHFAIVLDGDCPVGTLHRGADHRPGIDQRHLYSGPGQVAGDDPLVRRVALSA